MKRAAAYLAYARKLAAFVAGAVADLVARGVLHGNTLVAAEVLIGAATAAGIFKARNAVKP